MSVIALPDPAPIISLPDPAPAAYTGDQVTASAALIANYKAGVTGAFFADLRASGLSKFVFDRDSVAVWPRDAAPVRAFETDEARLTPDGLIIEREMQNAIDWPGLDGWTPGVLGEGGYLGRGWTQFGDCEVEVLYAGTGDTGLPTVRVKISRSGGSPSASFVGLRPTAYPGSAPAGGMAFHGLFRIIQAEGIATATLEIAESTTTPTFVRNHTTAIPIDGFRHQVIVQGYPFAGDIFLPQIVFGTSGATDDFAVIFEFCGEVYEPSSAITDITSFATGKKSILGDNIIPSPDFAGAELGVVGADGDLPEHWVKFNNSGSLAVTVTALDDGSMIVKLDGAGSTTAIGLRFWESFTAPPLSVASQYLVGLPIEVLASTNIDALALEVLETSADGMSFIGGSGATVPISGPGGYVSAVRTPASGHRVFPQIDATVTAMAVTCSITLRVGNPFFGLGSEVDEGRAADDVSLSGIADGTYDIMFIGSKGGFWELGAAVSGGTHDITPPADLGTLALTKAIAFTAGDLTRDEMIQLADWIDPAVFRPVTNTDLISYCGREWRIARVLGEHAQKFAVNRRNALRLEVRSGDLTPLDAGLGGGQLDVERSLLDDGNGYNYGTSIWRAFSFKIEPGAPVSTNHFCLFADFHNSTITDDHNTGNYFNIALHQGDYFAVEVSANTDSTSGPQTNVVNYVAGAPIERGVWHHLVINFKPDSNPAGAGFCKVWLDGAQVVNYTGQVGYSGAAQTYGQIQIYRYKSPETLAIQYANDETGTTSLMARVANPLPIL